MPTLESGQILAIVATIAAALLLTLGLLWMAFGLSRRSAAIDGQIEATWESVRQRLGLAARPRSGRGRELYGQYDGRPLAINAQYSRADSRSFTHVAVAVAFQADVYFQAITSKTLGMRYRPSGDAELDSRFFFRVRPDDLLAPMLANPTLRRLLLQSQVEWLLVTPYQVRCSVLRVEKDQQRLALLVELVSATADVVAQQLAAGLAVQPPLDPDFYQFYGVKRITGNAARLVLILGVLLVIACAIGSVVVWQLVARS